MTNHVAFETFEEQRIKETIELRRRVSRLKARMTIVGGEAKSSKRSVSELERKPAVSQNCVFSKSSDDLESVIGLQERLLLIKQSN